MEKEPLSITTKDVQRVTGKTDRAARYLMACIRKSLGKTNRQLISVSEFCVYIGLSEAEVRRRLSER